MQRLISYIGEWGAYALVSYGLWLAYEPLGFIGAGVLIFQALVGVPMRTDTDESTS
jgi:hypothetical protein